MTKATAVDETVDTQNAFLRQYAQYFTMARAIWIREEWDEDVLAEGQIPDPYDLSQHHIAPPDESEEAQNDRRLRACIYDLKSGLPSGHELDLDTPKVCKIVGYDP